MLITNHAKDRLKERNGINKKSNERIVKRVLDKGMKHADCKGRLRKYVDGLYLSHRTANNIRLYGDKVYLFHDEILITVLQIPTNLVKFVNKIEK